MCLEVIGIIESILILANIVMSILMDIVTESLAYESHNPWACTIKLITAVIYGFL